MFCFKRTEDELKHLSTVGNTGITHLKKLAGKYNRHFIHLSLIISDIKDSNVRSYVSTESDQDDTVGEFVSRFVTEDFFTAELTIHTDTNHFLTLTVNKVDGVVLVSALVDKSDIKKINDCIGYRFICFDAYGGSMSIIFNNEVGPSSCIFCFIKKDEYVDVEKFLLSIRQYTGERQAVALKNLNRGMISLILNYYNHDIDHLNDPVKVAILFANPFDTLSQKRLLEHDHYTAVVKTYTRLIESVKKIKSK